MEELLKKIEEQQIKIDAIYASVEKLRKYFLWTLVVTVVTVVVPLVALVFMVPYAISTLSGAYGGLL
jgi:type IV secretory pathway component VirB8